MTDTRTMSEADATAVEDAAPAVADPAHGHETSDQPLGPVDTRAWAMAIGGGAIGVLMALALFIAGQG